MVVFDAAHTAEPIVDAVNGRKVVAVVCTHGHNDHVTVAPELGKTLDAPVLLHPADEVLWRMTHPDKDFRAVSDGATLTVAGTELQALHTPGHSPGSVCWYAPELGAVFSGDTLFSGGPGATGRSFSDFPTILQSISDRLGALPGDTVVLHRPRRHHHHRRRDRPLRGVGGPGPLTLPARACEKCQPLRRVGVQTRTLTAEEAGLAEDPALLDLELLFGQRTGIPQRRHCFESLQPDALAAGLIRTAGAGQRGFRGRRRGQREGCSGR